MHEKGYVHRDLKPANLMIGNTPETESIIYIIDYGLSNKYYFICYINFIFH